MFKKLMGISKQNKLILLNMFGAFFVKGGSLFISIILLPVYIHFFQDQTVLGIWYTVLSVLNWVNLFDLGLGQGLRNQLPVAIEMNDKKMIKECISTTYYLMTIVAIVIMIIGMLVIPKLNWNNIFNVTPNVIQNEVLIICVQIIFCGIMMQLVLKIITSIMYAIQKSAVVNVLSLMTNAIILLMLLIVPPKDIASNLIMMSIINVIAANVPYIGCTLIVFSSILKESKPCWSAFSRIYIKDIFSVGLALLWLQVVFMIISSVNEFLISNLTEPKYVVEYQAYFKIFKTAAMLMSLALTPIWSAVTRFKAQKDYNWIIKVYKIFIIGVGVCLVGELSIISFLQRITDIWLGKNVINVNIGYAIAFVFSSVILVLHNVNTTIGNGLSYFRLQIIWMTFAAVIFVPLSYILVQATGSWIGVVIANSISMLPYELLAPAYTMRYIRRLE